MFASKVDYADFDEPPELVILTGALEVHLAQHRTTGVAELAARWTSETVEIGAILTISLAQGGRQAFRIPVPPECIDVARRGEVFWINRDGTRTRMPVRDLRHV